MSIAKVTVKCSVCGQEYEIRKECRNTTEKANYEKYIQTQKYHECGKCAHDRMMAETIAKSESYNLPEIEGKSEKQVKFATDLRAKYLDQNESKAKCAVAVMTETDKVEKFAADHNMTADEAVKAVLAGNRAEIAYKAMTLTEARSLIDLLINVTR